MKKIGSMLFVFFLSIALLLSGCDAKSEVSSLESTSAAVSQTSRTSTENTTKPKQQELMKVHFIDVGQGDSIFIELPDKRSMLIDAGESKYGKTVVNTIKAAKKDRLDYVIATHPHSDHIGGMSEVIKSFEIGSVFMPEVSRTTTTYKNLLAAIQSKGLKINTAQAGVNIINTDNLKADILAPVKDNYKDLNDWSAVLKLTYGSTSFLFMGDATATSESDITGNVKADVLKAGYHGGRTATSDSFLTKVSPEYAVISVGKGNPYGHPTAEVLNKLTKANVKVYRTDLSETLVFTSDGKEITVN